MTSNRPAAPAQRLRNLKWLALALAVGLTLALYLPTLGYWWVADDYNFALPKGWVQVANFFNLRRGGGFYRPLTWLSFVLDYKLWGWFNPAAWRLENVLVNCGCAALVWRLLLGLVPPAQHSPAREQGVLAAGVAAVTFAVLPAHPGAVTWVDGRFDSLTGLFYLACVVSFVSYRRAPRWWLYGLTALFLVLGILAKEMGLTSFAVLILADLLCFDQPELRARDFGGWLLAKLRLHGPFVLLGGGYLLLRLWLQSQRILMMGYGSTPKLGQPLLDNIAGYIGMIVGLPGVVGLRGGAANLFLVGGLAVFAGLAWYGGRIGWFGLLWLLVSLAPVVSIPIFDQATRYVYLPSVGLAIMLGAGVARLAGAVFALGLKQWLAASLVALPILLLVALGGWGTMAHNDEWRVAGEQTRSLLVQLKQTYPDVQPNDRLFFVGPPFTYQRASVWNEGLHWAARMWYGAPDRVDPYRSMAVYYRLFEQKLFDAAIEQPNPAGGRDLYLRWQGARLSAAPSAAVLLQGEQ